MRASRWSSVALLGAAALVLAACQSDRPTGVPTNAQPQSFEVTADNYSAARTATSNSKVFYQNAIAQKKYLGDRRGLSQNIVQSPWDLTWNGGPVVTHATQWNIYVNCSTTAADCWGTGALTPRTFLRDYQSSSMVEILGQYTHVDPTGRFATVNELSTTVKFAADSMGTPTMTGTDLLAILHAASAKTGK